MSNSQLDKLKWGIKIGTEVTLKLSCDVVGDFNDENNFPHKLLLTNTQVSRLCKAFVNGSSANIKLLKIQLHKIGQSRRFISAPPTIPKITSSLANPIINSFVKELKNTGTKKLIGDSLVDAGLNVTSTKI